MNPLRGIAFKLGAVLLFVVMSSLVKAASAYVPPGQTVFFRALFAIPVILGWLVARGDLATGLRTANPLGHLWRGLIGTTAMGLGFAGLGMLPLSEVQAIHYAAPLLVVIFAAFFLGERVRLVRLSAVALGMTGVLIVLWPRLTTLGNGEMESRQALGAILVLMSAIFAAFAQVFVRKLVRTESTSAVVFWFSVSAATLSLVTVPFGWVLPPAQALGLMVLSGLLGGVGQIFLTTAYRHADASVIAPFDYASMIFAIAIGYFVFDEAPTGTMLLGALLVMSGGVLVIWRERKLGLKRGKARPGMTPQG